MKLKQNNNSGFTRVELIVVISVIALLLCFFSNNVFGISRKQHVSYCRYNFIQTYRALTAFKSDSQNNYPWQLPEKDGGSIEYVERRNSLYTYKHWLSLAKYIKHPKTLRCPADGNRVNANRWLEQKPAGEAGKLVVPFNSNNVFSYFVANEAKPDEPEYIITGDRNIFFAKYSNDNDAKGQIVHIGKKFTQKKTPRWSTSLHGYGGILLIGDGSTRFINDLKNEFLISANEKNTVQFPRGL